MRGNLCWRVFARTCDCQTVQRIEHRIELPLNIHMGKELAQAQKKKPWRVPAAMEDRSFQHVIDIRGYEPIEEIDEDFCDVPF